MYEQFQNIMKMGPFGQIMVNIYLCFYHNIGKIPVLYSFNFVEMASCDLQIWFSKLCSISLWFGLLGDI